MTCRRFQHLQMLFARVTNPKDLRVLAKRIYNQIKACRAGLRFERDFLKLHVAMEFGVDAADDILLATLDDEGIVELQGEQRLAGQGRFRIGYLPSTTRPKSRSSAPPSVFVA